MSVLEPLFRPFAFSVFGNAGVADPFRARLDAMPLVDAYRRDNTIVLHVDLPGVTRDSLKVTVDGQWLEISAERPYAPEPGDRVLLGERSFGTFQRRFRLLTPVDATAVVADLVDGVLTVSVPVKDSAPSAVQVRVNGQIPDGASGS